ncbi:MAG: tetratricopeptide repeat protein [Deltaproteobacteria bacterium]|nr:tetratricopeptide repeat protein [Deltaproteobacteria bacterium]
MKDRKLLPALVALALLVAVAYSNTFGVPFLFDDQGNILDPAAVKDLSNIGRILLPRQGDFVGGRPVTNLTFAVNWAVSGAEVWSYHAFNLLVHLGSVFLLFGLVRRTLAGERLSPVFGRHAARLAFFAALLWGLHPLHTQAVTYISQRFESLSGFFFLLTLYLAVRGWGSQRPWPWHLGAGAACLLGAGTKELVVAAPLVVLAYDAVFVHRSASPLQAVRRSPLLYGGLAAAMGLLAVLVLAGTTAAATPEPAMGRWDYLLTQAEVILHYLSLSAWPAGLSFIYHWEPASLPGVLPALAAVAALLLPAAYGLWKRHPAGFAGAWFFLILAPTSSILPLPFVAWEYRMYLPLAALCVLAVAAAYWLAVRFLSSPAREKALRLGAVAMAAWGLALFSGTLARNQVYLSPVTLWADALDKQPASETALRCVAKSLSDEGFPPVYLPYAKTALEKGVRENPDEPLGWISLGLCRFHMGELEQAVEPLETALSLDPDYAEAHMALGLTLSRLGRVQAAKDHFQKAVEAKPDYGDAYSSLGVLLAEQGDMEQAREHFEKAVRSNPDDPKFLNNLGRAELLLGNPEKAARLFARALELSPGFALARYNLKQAEQRSKTSP